MMGRVSPGEGYCVFAFVVGIIFFSSSTIENTLIVHQQTCFKSLNMALDF